MIMEKNKVLINDNYKKESWLPILGFIATLIASLRILLFDIIGIYSFYESAMGKKQAITIFVIFCVLALHALYLLIAIMSYKLEVTEDKIYLRSLFKKSEYNFNDSEICRYKRHRNTSLYRFSLKSENDEILVTTRYKEELLKILEKHNIQTNEIGKGDKL